MFKILSLIRAYATLNHETAMRENTYFLYL